MPETAQSPSDERAQLINAPYRWQISGEFIIGKTPDGAQVFALARRQMRKEIAAIEALLDEADRAARQPGEAIIPLVGEPSAWEKTRAAWRAKFAGKDMAEKYPHATMRFGAPFCEIEQDIAFLTRPEGDGYETHAMPLDDFIAGLRICELAISDYRRAKKGKVARLR